MDCDAPLPLTITQVGFFSSNSNYDKSRFVGHGDPGRLHLLDQIIDKSSLSKPHLIEDLKRKIGTSSVLEVMACRVAQGEIGRSFVRALAEVLNITVYASTQLVGPRELGGTYFLDYGYDAASGLELNGYAAASVPGLTTLLSQPTSYVSATFTHGYMGTQSNQQQPQDIYVFGPTFTGSDPAISSVAFRQDDTDGDGKFGGTGLQGNDLDGELVITFSGPYGMNGASQAVFPGYLNFRELENDGVHVFGFLLYSAPTTDQVTVSENSVKGTLNGSQDGWLDYVSGPLSTFNTPALASYDATAKLFYDHLSVGDLSDKDTYPGYQFTTSNWSSAEDFPNDAGGSDSYRVLSGPGKDIATNIGLVIETRVGNLNPSFNLPVHGEDRSNDTNAASSGLLDALNDYLAVKTPISISSPSVSESAASPSDLCELEYRVVLDVLATQDAPATYTYTLVGGTGIDGSDWTGTPTIGEVKLSDGTTRTSADSDWATYEVVLGNDGRLIVPESVVEFTVCVDVLDDAAEEAAEILTLTVGETIGVGTILDDDGVETITVNDVDVNEASEHAQFEVVSSAGGLLRLVLTDGTAVSPDDYGMAFDPDSHTIEYYDGAAWQPYDSSTGAPSTGGSTLHVRMRIEDDDIPDNGEQFTLTAQPFANSAVSAEGTATIKDDGTGVRFLGTFDGSGDPITSTDNLDLDDISINDVDVNEASEHAQFEVVSSAGGLLRLVLTDGTAVSPDDYGMAFDPDSHTIEYYDGAAWQPYDSSTGAPSTGGSTLHVRMRIEDDDIPDNGEQFTLTAQPFANSAVSAEGTATIKDDGTGVRFLGTFDGSGDPITSTDNLDLDDISINDVDVNEASEHAQFEVVSSAGGLLRLVLTDGTAVSPDDYGMAFDPDSHTIEYYDGAAWQPYDSSTGAPSTGGSTLHVRMRIEDDDIPDNGEQFTLTAQPFANSAVSAEGTATIKDDGTGVRFLGTFDGSGDPITSTDNLDLDDISINDVDVNEASEHAQFEVVSSAGGLLRLVLTDGTAVSPDDYGMAFDPDSHTIEYYDGAAWQPYDSSTGAPSTGGSTLHVRMRIEDDDIPDNGEQFTLTAQPFANSAVSAEGTATIKDDGTGVRFLGTFDGSGDPITSTDNLDLDDISINDVDVNEASEHAQFEVVSSAGGLLRLVLTDGTAVSPDDYGMAFDPDSHTIEYYDGAAWQPYDSSTGAPSTGGSTLHVRMRIEDDDIPDNGEQFTLTAQPFANSAVSAEGTATIKDDGTGVRFLGTFDGSGDPITSTDNLDVDVDPTVLSITDITVNEASPYAVFTVTGPDGTTINDLSLEDGDSSGNNKTLNLSDNQVEYWDGSSWEVFSSATPITIGSNETLLLRVAIDEEQDTFVDDGEKFQLIVTSAGGPVVTGVATINDNGGGTKFPGTVETTNPPAPTEDPTDLDTDTDLVSINDVIVNEASDYAVNIISGENNLLLNSLTIVDAGNTVIQNFDIRVYDYSTDTWVPFTTGTQLNDDGILPVRTTITEEQEEEIDSGEVFQLQVNPTGTVTIMDDGTGVIFTGEIDPATGFPVTSDIGLDDDTAPTAPSDAEGFNFCGWLTWEGQLGGDRVVFFENNAEIHFALPLDDANGADLIIL